MDDMICIKSTYHLHVDTILDNYNVHASHQMLDKQANKRDNKNVMHKVSQCMFSPKAGLHLQPLLIVVAVVVVVVVAVVAVGVVVYVTIVAAGS